MWQLKFSKAILCTGNLTWSFFSRYSGETLEDVEPTYYQRITSYQINSKYTLSKFRWMTELLKPLYNSATLTIYFVCNSNIP